MGLYILKMIFSSGLFLAYYWLVLRNARFHQYNRFYLLLALTLAPVLPFINLELYQFSQPLYDAPSVLPFTNSFSFSRVQPSYLSLQSMLCLLTLVISVTLLSVLVRKVARIYRIKRLSAVSRMNGFSLVETDIEEAPFTFLNNLFWRKNISMEGDSGQKIFKHELTHIREGHTYDKLFSQIVACIFWMNPFNWIIQKELNVIHEFIADSKTIDIGDSTSLAKMLLQSYNDGRYLNPAHSFFNSHIKRRLTMIAKCQNESFSYMRRLLALPITMLVLVVFSFTIVHGQIDPKTNPGPTKVYDVSIAKISDSLAHVAVKYYKPDGSLGSFDVDAKYSNSPVNHDPGKGSLEGLKQLDRNVTSEEVKQLLIEIIESPPDHGLFYLDGKEIKESAVRKLDPNKIATLNIYRGEDAIKRHGKKAANGAIEFTTH